MHYQHCTACGQIQYFDRPFCAACGSSDVAQRDARGTGAVAAATMLHRAPSKEMAHLVPYEILLVDMDEGFRAMARGPGGSVIGQRVRLTRAEDGLLHATAEGTA
ncbi:hypothetical protein GCM10011360_14860 [Primorskyibacter flagellatus]|uniref:DUF35 domain-containing protein n=2 Tax=Primorskyibacter flagellatus TaxID=1387277 RepID=A0A917A5K3_9RHOB|nr:hypothetical protein GCM10011360_14860 [Primorskyibacter flagellatus]